jgi:hypothetical protein
MTDKARAWIKHQKALTPDRPILRLLRTGRHPRAPPRAEGLDRPLEGQVRPGLGQDPRGIARPPDRSSVIVPPDTKLAAEATCDQGLGPRSRPTRSASSRARPRSSPHSRNTPTPKSAACSRPSRRSAKPTTRSSSTYRRRQRHQRRGWPQRRLQRDTPTSTACTEKVDDHAQAHRSNGAVPETYPHMAAWLVGRVQCPVRLDEAGAIRFRRHAQWRRGLLAEDHQGEATRSAPSSATSSTSPRPCSRPIGLPEPTIGQWRQSRSPWRGASLVYCVRGREGDPSAAQDAVFRNRRQSRHLS